MHDDPATGQPPHASVRPGVAGVGSGGMGRPAATGEDRSPNAWVCPFLRSSDEDDALGLPVEAPDPANRCAALHDPVPQSLRQQELVCLTSGHVNCPRYLRGSIGATERLERVPRVQRVERTPGNQTLKPGSRTVTPATAGALATFALAFLVSVGFVIANGGLVLTAASGPSPSGGVLGEVETVAPTAAPTVAPTPTPAPTPPVTPSPTPTASPSASPTPTPSPTSSPTPKPTPKPTPRPTSGRFALLTPCPKTPGCYVYLIRSGDNLYSIANYFGVSLTRVQQMNPWVNGGLVVGRGLRIPTPTR